MIDNGDGKCNIFWKSWKIFDSWWKTCAKSIRKKSVYEIFNFLKQCEIFNFVLTYFQKCAIYAICWCILCWCKENSNFLVSQEHEIWEENTIDGEFFYFYFLFFGVIFFPLDPEISSNFLIFWPDDSFFRNRILNFFDLTSFSSRWILKFNQICLFSHQIYLFGWMAPNFQMNFQHYKFRSFNVLKIQFV